MLETVFKGITFCWDGFKVRRLPYGTVITEFLGKKKKKKQQTSLSISLQSTSTAVWIHGIHGFLQKSFT